MEDRGALAFVVANLLLGFIYTIAGKTPATPARIATNFESIKAEFTQAILTRDKVVFAAKTEKTSNAVASP